MHIADEVIALRHGTPELAAVREAAKNGDKAALKKYVYFGAWQQMQFDPFIPMDKKKKAFLLLIEADLIEVTLGK